MKKIVIAIVVVLVLVSGIIFVPRLVHKCDDCGKLFVGTGYKANIASDILSEDEQIICKKCAEEQHALSITFGKSVKDFKIGLFE